MSVCPRFSDSNSFIECDGGYCRYFDTNTGCKLIVKGK